jgi:beta-lactamase superfamily II metal-dependent hydrolase
MLSVLRLLGVFVLALAGIVSAQSRNLEIYWIDVEGGAATLIVAPSGESLLDDAGYAVDDRDAKRIFAATQQAGLKKIDAFVLSHYHGDHVGGLPALAKMIPIDRFFDHGDAVEEVDRERLEIYKKVAGSKRTVVKAGDVIPMKGVQVQVVASDSQFISKPISGGGPNPICATAEQKAPAAPENGRMVGALFTYGKFKFLDLADLDWANEMALTCPVNKLGTVTIWQADRHGSLHGAGAPAMLGAIKPQIIVVNNGPRKGLGQVDKNARSLTNPGVQNVSPAYSYEKISKLPGVEDIWQGHLSLLTERQHNTAENLIANFEETAECKGNWIKASVAPDGRFTITNGRNGFSKTYTAR